MTLLDEMGVYVEDKRKFNVAMLNTNSSHDSNYSSIKLLQLLYLQG
jgi:hypothetical protein